MRNEKIKAKQTLPCFPIPSAALFFLLLCDECTAPGPRKDDRWANLITGAVMAALVLL
jgi:hypothetical protein